MAPQPMLTQAQVAEMLKVSPKGRSHDRCFQCSRTQRVELSVRRETTPEAVKFAQGLT